MLVLSALAVLAVLVILGMKGGASIVGILIVLAFVGAGIDKWRSMFR
jgi:hypothetical protein